MSRGHNKGESRLTRLKRLTPVCVPWPPAWLVPAAAGLNPTANEESPTPMAGESQAGVTGAGGPKDLPVATKTSGNRPATVGNGRETGAPPATVVGGDITAAAGGGVKGPQPTPLPISDGSVMPADSGENNIQPTVGGAESGIMRTVDGGKLTTPPTADDGKNPAAGSDGDPVAGVSLPPDGPAEQSADPSAAGNSLEWEESA
jgi:hypothetical protein